MKLTYAHIIVSTHSRPKAAGRAAAAGNQREHRFNTQPPEGGWARYTAVYCPFAGFQHTAARRRLALHHRRRPRPTGCFNTQPPEGGWD